MSHLEANLEALRTADPGIGSDTLHSLRLGEREEPQILETPSGLPTAKYRDAFIHSRYDPAKEASALLSREPLEGSTAAIVLGFGLGYVAEEVRRRFPGLPMLVVEPDSGFFRAALSARDLRGFMGSGPVWFSISPNPAVITEKLESLPMGNPKILRLRPIMDRNPAFFRAVEQLIGSFLLRRDININTLGRFGMLWVRNLARNIRLFADSPGTLPFEGMFRGVPALMLAGGPSFDDIAPVLQDLSTRLLVVCVDTPLRSCLEAGVKPDFVVMVDPQYWASRYLDWTDGFDGLLFAEPSTHPRSLRHPRRQHILGGSLFPLGEYLESLIGEKGRLGAGGSVSTSAWDLCRLLGASPVYTSGLDLGFPGLRTHCRGAFFEEGWIADSDRLSPVEASSFRRIREIGLFPMPSNDGPPTLTDRRMILYKWWFENQLSMRPWARTFSLSGRAVAVEGMPKADVGEILRLPVIRPEIEERKTRLLRAVSEHAAARGNTAAVLDGALSSLVSGLEELGSTAERAMDLTRVLARAVSRGGKRASLLSRLDALDRRIMELSTRNIAGFLIQGLIQKITGGGSGQANEKEVISVSEEMYRGIAESARFHCSVLSRARNSLGKK